MKDSSHVNIQPLSGMLPAQVINTLIFYAVSLISITGYMRYEHGEEMILAKDVTHNAACSPRPRHTRDIATFSASFRRRGA